MFVKKYKWLHLLFNEWNYSKNEVFSKSFTYAAEFSMAVSFNTSFMVELKSIREKNSQQNSHQKFYWEIEIRNIRHTSEKKR